MIESEFGRDLSSSIIERPSYGTVNVASTEYWSQKEEPKQQRAIQLIQDEHSNSGVLKQLVCSLLRMRVSGRRSQGIERQAVQLHGTILLILLPKETVYLIPLAEDMKVR